MTMISSVRVKKLFAYLLPMLGDRTKAELDNIYAEIEKILGYDAKKASRLRHDAKERESTKPTSQLSQEHARNARNPPS